MNDGANEAVDAFLLKGKLECLREFQRALQRIARLPWWRAWRAPEMAERALHWGPYWDRGFTTDTSPKCLLAYYVRIAWRWAADTLTRRRR